MDIVPNCINDNKAVKICVSDRCIHPNPFICDSCVNNQCQQLHEDCITSQWKKIKSMIEKSKKSNNPDFIKLNNVVEQTINKAIKYLQRQLQYFNKWKSTFGLPTQTVNMFKCIQERQQHKLTGKLVAQLLKDVKTEKEIQKFNEVKMKKIMKEVLEKMEQTLNMIREMYSSLDGNIIKKEKQIKVVKQEFKLSQIPKLEIKQKMEIKQEANRFDIKSLSQFRQLERKQKAVIKQDIKKPVIKQNLKLSQRIFNYFFKSKLSLKIKQRYLEEIIKRLKDITEKPINLEIKFASSFQWDNLYSLAESFKNPNLKSLKTLTLYYPFTLGYDSDRIDAEKLISSSLLSLPHLQSFTIIASDINSMNGYKSLGSKLNALKDKEWRNRQTW